MVSNARLGCCFISYVASVCAINTLAGSAGVQRAADGVLFFMFMYIILIVEGPDGFVLAVPQGWDIGLQGIAVKGNGKVVSSNPRYEVVKEERSTGNCVVVGRAKGRPGIEDSRRGSLIGLTGLTSITRHLTWRIWMRPSFLPLLPCSRDSSRHERSVCFAIPLLNQTRERFLCQARQHHACPNCSITPCLLTPNHGSNWVMLLLFVLGPRVPPGKPAPSYTTPCAIIPLIPSLGACGNV